MSSLTVEEDQKWLPTHVQVTVLRGRGLRGKGKHGTSDVYTIIQLGKEKYSTCVAEKTTEPEWREECSFELQPGVLEGGGGGGGRSSGCPAGSNELVLIAMHRALIGLDVFLGQAVVQLDKVFHETRCVRNEWYKLNSKSGKKEKERGEIQVTVQFTRNNLTASMYDLVMKDKGASTFSKLKERIKGKRRASEEDSASAVLPSGYGSLQRMRQRLPSDGGGEEDYEDDEGGEARRSKMRTFFLRGKLRKSSDTRSSTSLGSESSESSRGGSLSPTAGISVVVSDLSNSPSNSSNLTADNSPDHTADTSSLQCEFGDGEISIAVPQPTVCVNGSHAYGVRPPDPGSGKPSNALGPLQKSLPLSVSLQNLRPSDPIKSPAGDGRRWSFDKPGEEEKAAIAAALEKSGPMLGDEELEKAFASSSSSSVVESESQGKKHRLNSHGRKESEGKGQTQTRDESEQATHKGWFGSKESHSKPSLVVSPKLEPSTDPHHARGPPVVDPDPLLSPLHHTNPFCPSQTTPPPLSPCNPFFSLLQHNPFYDTLTAQPSKPPPPPLPYLSSARPPIAQLFPQARNPDPTPSDWKRPLPPAPLEGELDSEWDESFEAFAAGRLQSPEDLTAECKTQPNTPGDRPLERCSNAGASLPLTDQNTTAKDALRHRPRTEFGCDADRAVVQATNAYHVDAFPQLLETIPEHASFESDAIALNASTNDACAESDRANAATNAINSSDTNTHEAPRHASPAKLNSSSPDPGSSGIGSSAEEDFLSCLSSYSDKFSASSSEEAEAHILENNVLGFEKSSDSKSKSDDDIADLSSGDVAQQTVIQHSDDDDEADSNGLGGSTARQPAEITVSATGTGSEDANLSNSPSLAEPQPKFMTSLQTDHENGEEGIRDFNGSLQDLSKMLNDSSLGSTHPSLHIITSSPDVSLWDSPIDGTTLGGLFDSSHIGNSPNRHFEDTPSGPSRLSDRSASSSFFQSLYVSTDSQDYQTCGSHPSSKSSSGSEPNWTLHSANSTLCGERSDGRTTPADGQGEPCGEGIDQTDRTEGSVCGAEDDKANLEPSFTTVDDFCLLPVASTDTNTSCNPRKLTDFGEVISKCPPAHDATLHRSHSEGALTPAFDELLLPSFGSDPGTIQESSSAKPRPHLPSLTSFAPPLKPQSSSSPVALCSLSSLANATPRSPPVPNPMLQETPPPPPQQQQAANQQAANQQISPHPVKPLTTATPAEEKRSEGRSVLATGLEKLKSTIHPGRSSQPSEQETDRKKTVTQGAGSYYHLNHSQLVSLLVQREAELARQRAEFERQKLVLAKREVELRKLKPQVKDLEDYIDTLLVRIMEQKPTLLQVRSKLK